MFSNVLIRFFSHRLFFKSFKILKTFSEFDEIFMIFKPFLIFFNFFYNFLHFLTNFIVFRNFHDVSWIFTIFRFPNKKIHHFWKLWYLYVKFKKILTSIANINISNHSKKSKRWHKNAWKTKKTSLKVIWTDLNLEVKNWYLDINIYPRCKIILKIRLDWGAESKKNSKKMRNFKIVPIYI